ncbi:keratinocyte differentiation-associated protein isoform X2 [Physeter macrocephalus]|uniref:Keratinocyte differentiation-associated protein isoform X2 n=1 Tax=Physeter macrocephalus TaxID=9755 RepID=A0A2Y9EQ43_PHYMC|nr:keratinocyte differentiation-associated protein isoform X2 [Physeter catodon]|eukprot:XP_007106605.1 keratinocyte differentiation-associated protein [Physeter catodon]
MKIPVLAAVVLLSLLAFHSAQGAALGSSEEGVTVGNNAAGSKEDSYAQFLDIDKLRSVFKANEFLNWNALLQSVKRRLPFLNWDAFPKLRGMMGASTDAQ